MTEIEQLRGIEDGRLWMIPDDKLSLLAFAILMETQGVDDKRLIQELKDRAIIGLP